MSEPMELDEKAVEAAARAIELTLQFVPHGQPNMFGEWVVTVAATEAFHDACQAAASKAIRAALSATPDMAGQVAIPFIKE